MPRTYVTVAPFRRVAMVEPQAPVVIGPSLCSPYRTDGPTDEAAVFIQVASETSKQTRIGTEEINFAGTGVRRVAFLDGIGSSTQ